jgi:5-methylcytosine-specific restriction endonuclease McrA
VKANLQLLHRHCHDRKTARDGSAHERRRISRGAV